MTWRGATSPSDRLFACLVYLIPLFDGLLRVSESFLRQFPAFSVIFVPLAPLLQIYTLPFVDLAIFFAVFMLVVRNLNIRHFIRYNAMQAILLSIAVFLCSLLLGLLVPGLRGTLFLDTLYNVVFMGLLAAVIYSVVKSAMGQYAEIPTISNAVYSQVP